MAKECIFCKIISGEIAANVVLEEQHAIAFLDHRPLFPGHSLLIPKEHIETLLELPEKDLAPFFSSAQRLAAAIQLALQAEGTFVAINNRVSQSVPHLHVHIVPRRRKDGLKGFFWPRHKYRSEEEILTVENAIRAALTELQARAKEI
ncbi:MAG TPA: HIT family protein [Pyrinomonadaceae bacterium]|nr:HIT family protein [Pyrinomonadaceae bacterium]